MFSSKLSPPWHAKDSGITQYRTWNFNASQLSLWHTLNQFTTEITNKTSTVLPLKGSSQFPTKSLFKLQLLVDFYICIGLINSGPPIILCYIIVLCAHITDFGLQSNRSRAKLAPLIKGIALAEREGRKEMFYLTTYLTYFIYGYNMASDMW